MVASHTLPRLPKNSKKNINLAEFDSINGKDEKHTTW
jgi:hypothetical protein